MKDTQEAWYWIASKTERIEEEEEEEEEEVRRERERERQGKHPVRDRIAL
jgi:hypothetical protein